MRYQLIIALTLCCVLPLLAETPRVFPPGQLPLDSRLGELRTLNSYFPFEIVDNKKHWEERKAEIERRIVISQGLWPEPTKTNLHAVIHGRLEFDDYTVERVYFQSIPGHFVTGSLYRPKGIPGPFPAVLCPHGHWADARFYDAGEEAAKRSITDGAERFMSAARNHIQARCVQLARMGCIAFLYDTTGNSDSIQLAHRPETLKQLNAQQDWKFFTVQADLRLQNMMGLQTWNSVRSIDFLLQLPDVDPERIGVTGASGGGTQSMIVAAIDDRIAAAMPCVMVSTSMQGGCSCENAPLLRIDQGNIDIAAAIAPRPLGLTAADDWTIELETKGYPDLRNLYATLGQNDRLTAAFNTHFKHNYNHVNRAVMYGFFNQHFKLGFRDPVLERDFQRLTKEQLTVWNDEHPAPSGKSIGEAHEVELLRLATRDSNERIAQLIPARPDQLAEYQNMIGKAWETILGRRLDQVGELEFTETEKKFFGGFEVTLGRLDHNDASEQIPVMMLGAKKGGDRGFDRGFVVWIGNDGKASLLEGIEVIAPVAELLQRGYSVITADLISQGEFVPDAASSQKQRMWYQRKGTQAWERFSGYTYGYNHSLFVQRTHDVLSLVKFAMKRAKKRPVHLVALGSTAGPIALAARSQAADFVDETVIDLDGFQFRNISAHDSPMFVPGAVKYLDVAGLLGLCVPHRVAIAGLDDDSVARAVYSAAGVSDALQVDGWTSVAEILSQQDSH